MSWFGYSWALAAVAPSPAARASANPPDRSHLCDRVVMGFLLHLVASVCFRRPHPTTRTTGFPSPQGGGDAAARSSLHRESQFLCSPRAFGFRDDGSLERLLACAAELRQDDEGEHHRHGRRQQGGRDRPLDED